MSSRTNVRFRVRYQRFIGSPPLIDIIILVYNISALRELVAHEHEETTAKNRGQLDISRLPLSFSFNTLKSCNR